MDIEALRERLRSETAAPRSSAAPDASRWQDHEECYANEYADVANTPPIDVVAYVAAFDCVEPGGWLFGVQTADAWSAESLDYMAISIDSDDSLATGCNGDDYVVLGYYDPDEADLVAAVFSMGDCSEEAFALEASATLVHPEPTEAYLLFDNVAIGSPSRIRWYGEIAAVSDADSEFFPKDGEHVESGFEVDCTPTAYDGFTASTKSPSAAARGLRAAGYRDVTVRPHGLVSFAGSDAAAARALLRRTDPAARVAPNRLMRWSLVPNDPQLPEQWNLAAVRAPQAWDITRSAPSITVAVIDSGIDATHPQLAGKLVGGYDVTTDTPLGTGDSDRVGHGTAVAGIIAARTNDGAGLAGLGFDTTVMPVKAGDEDGPTNADVAEAIYWAVDHGARIVNMSLGDCAPSSVIEDAVDYAESKGVLLVASAGNDGPGAPATYPAAYPSVIAVGATGHDGAIAEYSNTGAFVDIVAPGGTGDGEPSHSIPVLEPGGGEAAYDGTSFSAPHVAAAAALVLSTNAGAPLDYLRNQLLTTARDLGAPGRDDVYGVGLLDAARAVGNAPPSGPAPQPAQPKPGTAPDGPTLAAPVLATAGVVIRIGGSARPGSLVELWGVTAPNRTITRVNTPAVRADANGVWQMAIRPLRNVTLQARVGSLGSPTRFTAVRTNVVQSVSPLAGCVVQVSGAVFEPKPGATVYMRAVTSSGSTITLGTGAVQRDGRFLLRRAFPCGATLRVYTVIAGDAVNRPGSTPTQRVTTRR